MTSSLFSGLCFGDISLSQESSSSMHAATLPDIPNSTVTPGCGDRDVTPPVVYDNTSHSPSRANYLDDFDPAGHCLDGDILPTDPEDDREYPLPDTVSLSQNACVFAIASVDAEPIELGQGAYSQPHDPAVHAEPLVVLSAGDISNFNILDPDMNGEQIQPDAYSDILSASLQADSLHSDYIGFHCSPDQGLAAEITRNASQNSHYDLHCANEPLLSVASADSDLLTSSQILLERIVRDTDIIQFPSEAALYSSPPCSSPAKIFSSSPPLSSQTSASTEPSPEETEVSKQTLETVHNYDDQSQLISSNASEQAWNEDTGDNYNVDALPPSSSPLPLVSSPFWSSSPLQTVQEDMKQPKDDNFLQDCGPFHTPAESESKDISASRDTYTSHITAEVTQQSGAAPEFPMPESRSLDVIAPIIRLEGAPHANSHAILAPGPKRPTVMSHLRQHKKLSTPFRSPLIKKENDQFISPLPAVSKLMVPAAKTIMRSEVEPVEVKHTVLNNPKKKHRTVRAAAQFKSPLSAAASSNVMPSVRMTPTIQSLERRVQVLRRAVKVKKDGEEELLESLAKRWTEAAREVAWELWDLVKDNGANEGGSWSREPKHKRGFEESWGWEEKGDQKRLKIENSWGWDEPQRKEGGEDEDQMQGIEPRDENDDARDEGEDKPENTMGLMLRQFGIAPDTLGWNEEDGMFAESLLR